MDYRYKLPNEKLARFLGTRPVHGMYFVDHYWLQDNYVTVLEMKFHLDRNWLMLVVQKIRRLGYTVDQVRDSAYIRDKRGFTLFACKGFGRHQNLYQCCIAFVDEWFEGQGIPSRNPFADACVEKTNIVIKLNDKEETPDTGTCVLHTLV